MAADYAREPSELKITGNDYGGISDSGQNTLAVSSSGELKIDWSNCPINEDSIRGIARQEMQLEINSRDVRIREFERAQENLSPIEILRKKVYSWLTG